MNDFSALLRALVQGEAEFIVIGGVAGFAHGSARLTQDIDVVYRRTPENIERLVRALESFHPYLRGAPRGLPFRWDAATVRGGLNFTLETEAGDIDILGEIAGGGGYDMMIGDCIDLEVFGVVCKCLTLERLIEVKKAAGRPKDFEAIAELNQILRLRGQSDQDP